MYRDLCDLQSQIQIQISQRNTPYAPTLAYQMVFILDGHIRVCIFN